MGWVTVTFQNGKKVHYGDKDRLAEDDERRGFLTRVEGWDESRCRPTGSYDRRNGGIDTDATGRCARPVTVTVRRV